MHDTEFATPEGFLLPKPLALPDVRDFRDLYEIVRPWDFETMNHRNGVRPHPELVPDPVKIGIGRAEISPFCSVDIDAQHGHLAVVAKEIVVEAVKGRVFDDTVLSTKVILHPRNNRALVVLDHQNILANIWLAYIDPTTVPTTEEVRSHA